MPQSHRCLPGHLPHVSTDVAPSHTGLSCPRASPHPQRTGDLLRWRHHMKFSTSCMMGGILSQGPQWALKFTRQGRWTCCRFQNNSNWLPASEQQLPLRRVSYMYHSLCEGSFILRTEDGDFRPYLAFISSVILHVRGGLQ